MPVFRGYNCVALQPPRHVRNECCFGCFRIALQSFHRYQPKLSHTQHLPGRAAVCTRNILVRKHYNKYATPVFVQQGIAEAPGTGLILPCATTHSIMYAAVQRFK